VRLTGELSGSFVKHLPGMEKSSYSKKYRAKKMKVCHKCARCNWDTRCRNSGSVSINWEDKIWCIHDGLSKESLDDIHRTLKMHPNGDAHRVFLNLFQLFQDQKECYRHKDLTINDFVCWFFKKIEGKANP